jgi:hypothetical protein
VGIIDGDLETEGSRILSERDNDIANTSITPGERSRLTPLDLEQQVKDIEKIEGGNAREALAASARAVELRRYVGYFLVAVCT